MKTVIVIQARMTSERFPGKILADIAGAPMLARVVRRARAAAGIAEVAIATTKRSSDDPVVRLAAEEDVRCIRGDENDVLSRYLAAAKETGADLVVRVTGDCPLLDPDVTARVARELLERAGAADYAANIVERTYPRGLDTEALFRDVLERSSRLGRSPKSREHVTWFLNRERPDLFVRHSIRDTADNSDLRWTVDTASDLQMVRTIYEGLDLAVRLAPYREILDHVRRNPSIPALNADQTQKDA